MTRPLGIRYVFDNDPHALKVDMDPRDFFAKLAATFVFFAFIAGALGSIALGYVPTSETFSWNVGFGIGAFFLVLAAISICILIVFIIWLS